MKTITGVPVGKAFLPPDSESLDSPAWMSAVTESGGWSASTATRMPRSV